MLSSYLRDKLLEHYLKGAAFPQPAHIYASLHTADPETTGADEVAGGSYSRVLVDTRLAPAAGGAKASNANVDFPGMPAAVVTHAGIWDAHVDGNFLVGGELAEPKTVPAGDTLRLTTGMLVATLE